MEQCTRTWKVLCHLMKPRTSYTESLCCESGISFSFNNDMTWSVARCRCPDKLLQSPRNVAPKPQPPIPPACVGRYLVVGGADRHGHKLGTGGLGVGLGHSQGFIIARLISLSLSLLGSGLHFLGLTLHPCAISSDPHMHSLTALTLRTSIIHKLLFGYMS